MKKIFTIINLVVIFFIIDFSISALYEYFARDIEIDDYFKALDVQQQKIEKKQFQNISYYKKIAARDLFKTKEIKKPEKKQPVKPAAPPPKKIQLTKLKLDLKGTVTGTGSEPFAIIRERGKRKEKLYKEGDAVDRAVVKVILRQRVILLVDGKEETLLMEKNKIQKNFKKSADGHKNKNHNNVLLTWTDVNKLTKNLEKLRKQVRVRPHFNDGKMDGFRISGIKQNSVFHKKLGLRNGDVVAGVNEQEIKSIEDVIKLYNKFKRMEGHSVMDVDIKRNGSQEKIIYSIE